MSNRHERRATKKAEVVVANIDRKSFSYTKGNVALNYTLRTDVPEELEAFKELMEMGIVDIDKALDKLKK